MKVGGIESVYGTIIVIGKQLHVEFGNVLYVPDLNFNLHSDSKIRKMQYSVLFSHDKNVNSICIVM